MGCFSAGPQLNNPLMLLEQYSDDDVDGLLSEGQDAGAAKDTSGDLDDKVSVLTIAYLVCCVIGRIIGTLKPLNHVAMLLQYD